MKIIIVGDGKVGATLVEHLSYEGHDIIVIDRDQKVIELLVNSYDVMGVCGNGASYEVQLEAGVGDAQLFVAATSSDELNILSCLMAKKAGAEHTIARVRNPDYLNQVPFFKDELGLSMIVNPELDAANEIAKVLRFPNAINIETFYRGLVDLAEVKIDANKTRLMQIAAFLIKNHSYQFVSVQQSEHEIWLVNPKNDEYPVIRLTSNESGALYFDKSRVLQVHSANSQVFKRESRLLQLCINDENSIDEDDEILISVVRREQIYGFDVSSVFPGIQKALTPFDNPQIEYALILKELEMNSRQKAVQKSNLLKSRLPLATTVIIALCVMIYGAVNLLAEAHGDQIACAVAMGAYYKAFVVLGGEYWRFLTSGFVHSDVFHLLMNMIALYNMGRFCEEVFGAKKMLLILLTSVISGCALMHLTNPNIVGMGMSGGIYGLMGAFLVYAGSRGVFRQRAFQVRLSNIIFVNMMLNFMPGVAAADHLGGLCCGLLWGLIFCDLKMDSVLKHTAACLVALALFLGYKTIQVKEVDLIYPGTDMKTAEIYKAIGLETYAENLLNTTFKYYVQIEEDAQ